MYLYDRAALKNAAKRDLATCYWKAVLVCFIYAAINGALSQTTSISTGWDISQIMISIGKASAVALLIYGPLQYGLFACFTDILRKGECNVETLFSGFKRYGSTLLLGLLEHVFVFLWSLLFVVPGIIKTIAYSMSFYIQRDNPDMTANECLQASIRLTNGHKMDIFMLYLSFIGWFALCILTVGIGFVFLRPYLVMSKSRMYDFLILNYNEANGSTNVEEIAFEEPAIEETESESQNPFDV